MFAKRAALWAILPILSSVALGQEYKVEALKEAAPATLAAPMKGELANDGVRIVTGDGKTFADIWLRKLTPALKKPAGTEATIQFPSLAPGEFLGVIRLAAEGHDYRDQSIVPGIYTVRYGLQPVNGDHLGVSPFRDYALLLPAAKDQGLAVLGREKLEKGSAESAGTSHPAILMLLAQDDTDKPGELSHNEEKKTWGVNLELALAVKGDPEPAKLKVKLIVVGFVMD